MSEQEIQIRPKLEQILGRRSPESQELCNYFGCEKFDRGEFYLREGAPITRIGIVFKGVLRIFTFDEQGNESNIQLVTEGQFVIGSFVPEKASDVNIQCITSAEIFTADYKSFLGYLEEHKKVVLFFENYLSKVHNQIQHQLSQYLRCNAKERYLLFLKENPNLVNQIPHYHIANYLGITQTQLSRIRNSLASKK